MKYSFQSISNTSTKKKWKNVFKNLPTCSSENNSINNKYFNLGSLYIRERITNIMLLLNIQAKAYIMHIYAMYILN